MREGRRLFRDRQWRSLLQREPRRCLEGSSQQPAVGNFFGSEGRVKQKKEDPKDDMLRELLEKFGGGNLSITKETAAELAAKGTPALDLPITSIEDDNDVVLGCAFWHQHA